jgi:hypothetical protein
MTRFPILPLSILTALLAAVSRAGGDDSVAVNAGADREYANQKFGGRDAGPKAESYVLAQGNSFGGLIGDASLQKAKFMDIANTLGPDLALQRYFPARDGKNADLLIVVHWGMTYIDRSGPAIADQMMGVAGYRSVSGEPGITGGGIADSGFAGADVDAVNVLARSGSGAAGPSDNPQLLGFAEALHEARYRALGLPWGQSKTIGQVSEDAFGEDIFGLNPSTSAGERYFVILEAYDFASIKQGKRGVKPKLVWSVHYSIPALGRNFTSALPAMSQVAAHYFGRNSGGLLLHAEKVPEGNVEIGDPTRVEDKKRE